MKPSYPQSPRCIRPLPLLAIGIACVLLAACHRGDDDDTAAAPPAASVAMPATTMPASPSTMLAPMPATTAEAYDAQGTSNEAAVPASGGMPPPVDNSPDTARDDMSPANPAASTDDDKH
jgi:hypothetical protein